MRGACPRRCNSRGADPREVEDRGGDEGVAAGVSEGGAPGRRLRDGQVSGAERAVRSAVGSEAPDADFP